MSENIANNTQRDYDKEPIVIVDRMPEIGFWFFMTFAIVPLFLVLFWMHFTGREIDWIHVMVSLAILYIPSFFYLKSKIGTDRSIALKEHEIVRTWNNEIVKVSLNNIDNIKKSFIDFYDKRQEVFPIVKHLMPVYAPLMLLLVHPYLILVKSMYKILLGFSNNSLWDTIVLFDKNGEMIAIFISTIELKEEIKEYFLLKGYDTDNLSMFYSTSYVFDGINNFLKDK